MLNCDFCGKSQKDVKRIIAGRNGVAICDSCVIECVQALVDNNLELMSKEDELQIDTSHDIPALFCGKCKAVMDITNISMERRKDGDTTVEYECVKCNNKEIKKYKF